MKKLSSICLIVSLAGCAQVNQGLQATNLVLQKVNDNLAILQRNSPLASAIIEFERLNPAQTHICMSMPAYNYANNSMIIEKNSFNYEEEKYKWERLSELGLAKRLDVKSIVFNLTPQGKKNFSDIPCSKNVSPYFYKTEGPALLYGKLEFNRFISIKENPYHKGTYHVTYFRGFTSIEEWAKDKELRRRWKLQGISEIESMKWAATIKVNSNGAKLDSQPFSRD